MKKGTRETLFFVGGVAIGGVATYFAMRKHFDDHYSQLATDEIASVKEAYTQKKQQVEQEIHEQKYQEKLERLGYWADTHRPAPDVLDKEVELIDISVEEDMVIDPDDEHTPVLVTDDDTRDLTKPHLITYDEYHDEEFFEKLELSYYEGDSVLADSRDVEVQDVEELVGHFLPSNFGHNSEEPDCQLIRNPSLKADFEVTRVHGKYTEVVLGFHEPRDKPTIRKMRDDE